MSKFSNKNWLIYFVLFALFVSGIFFLRIVNAGNLNCYIATSCSGTTVFRMQNTTNSHAGMPVGSTYPNLVCCAGGTGLGTNCSGTYVLLGTLSGANNAHFQDRFKTNYSSANDICLSVTGGTISAATSTSCAGYDTTVFSITGASGTNAHVATSTGTGSYATKICATATPAVVSITLDRSSFDYGKMNNNTSSSTLTLWNGVGIIATNGDAVANFYIYGANTANWTLAAATSTSNIYAHRFCNDTDNVCTAPWTNYTPMTTSQATVLKNSVGVGATVAFQLQMHTPNPSTVYTAQTAEVTVLAAAP